MNYAEVLSEYILTRQSLHLSKGSLTELQKVLVSSECDCIVVDIVAFQ